MRLTNRIRAAKLERVNAMSWEKEGVNYWDNPDCPRAYLEKSLVQLIKDVEGEELPANNFENYTDEALRGELQFYEYVSDK